MRNILALVGAAVVGFLVVGWYLGWYQVSSQKAPNGKQSLNVSINQEKINDDVKKGGELVDSFRDKAKDDKQPGPASSFFTPTPPPGEKDKNPSNTGWKPINANREGDEGTFNFRIPRN